MKAVLIATLGAEPQVISLATQTLLHQGDALRAVVVLHTHAAYEPVTTALPLLQNFFATQPTWPPLHSVLVPVDDVLEPAQFDQFSQSLYTVLKTWIAQPARIHLLLAGGRKPMAMLGMSVAQLVCGPDDRVWYLHSDEALRKSGRMLMEPGDQVQLIEIPLPRFTAAPPLFMRPFQAATPAAARDALAEEPHTIGQLCRGLVVRHLKGWSYAHTACELRSHSLVRCFVGYGLHETPYSAVTLWRFDQWVKTHQPRLLFTEILHQIDEDFPAQVQAAQVGDTFALRACGREQIRTALLRTASHHLLQTLQGVTTAGYAAVLAQVNSPALLGHTTEPHESRLQKPERDALEDRKALAARQLLTWVDHALSNGRRRTYPGGRASTGVTASPRCSRTSSPLPKLVRVLRLDRLSASAVRRAFKLSDRRWALPNGGHFCWVRAVGCLVGNICG